MGLTCAEKKLINCTCDVCEPGSGGCAMFLPAFGESEQEWPNGLRVVLYLVGLFWTFMGVAIVADVFMGAIEAITSKKRRVWNAVAQKHFTVNVWNDTVANLTLMALGSSAPEILLSLIELMSNEFYSGELGPSTIVGSAAFNLFMISAVCVSAIPSGQSRTIKEICVFRITAFFSVFAYIWLLVIVSWITPDVVDIWEGLITFLYFPILVSISYLADIGYFACEAKEEEEEAKAMPSHRCTVMDMTKDELASMEVSVRKKTMAMCTNGLSIHLTDEQLTNLMQFELQQPKSRAAYRVGATRKLVAGRRVSVQGEEFPHHRTSQVVPETIHEEEEDEDTRTPVLFEFDAAGYAVMENVGTMKVTIKVTCEKKFSKPVSVEYASKDGTAWKESDYVPVQGTLIFEPGEDSKIVEVKIIDDAAYEADEYFFLELSNPRCSEAEYKAQLGEHASCQIAIIDDDHPGVFYFEKEAIEIEEGIEDTTVAVKVLRKGGANGEVSCVYHTEDDSAVAGKDFVKVESEVLHFDHGQTEKNIELTIKPKGRYEVSEQFRLVLTQPKGGARFDSNTDGGEATNICTLMINPNNERQKRTDALMNTLMGNFDKAQIGHANWRDQIKDAIFVNGADSDEPPSIGDYVMHAITIFWKLLFALIPPVDFCDGWLCFCCSLLMIGLVTAFIGELASLVGCTLGMPDSITAITFVALGTSLPDTFASKTAAEQDPYADASIGNVTGSNSVNVFLGLGLPWTIGSIYWAAAGYQEEWKTKYQDFDVVNDYPDGGKFVVIGGDLGFSVTVFSICAIVCICSFMLRRVQFQAELGGPVVLKYVTSGCFACLWVVYIGLSSWKVVDTRSKDKCYQ